MCVLDKIILLLGEQNKKQIDLTNHLGISKNAFTNWKAGDNTSYIKHLPKIASFFNVSVDYLLDREQPKQQLEQNQVDDFTYAMYDETIKDLTEEEKELLLAHVRLFRKTIGK